MGSWLISALTAEVDGAKFSKQNEFLLVLVDSMMFRSSGG